ncbi:hypothetical protein Ahy_A07g033450 [Arachis hypogaea]|uniref:Uncharacterized protein n=1 Tax=Arachis hypogaea TaxID=3818 RepID=A0A445C9E7_ARAHY|nr:hypothetical protein Ahy_A07g033450 [Arachis hypogaea]
MEFSILEGGSNSTLINSNEGNEELTVGKVVIQERSKGVSCNKGHVIGLDLSKEFITGGLNNSSLFNLYYLQSLNLVYNVFGSPIPSEIKKLKNLKHLNLSNAGFYGKIPKEISYLKKLVSLDLSTPFTLKTSCYVDKITDVIVMRKDELDLRHELPDHSGISEEEIPVIGMCFESLPLAQKFYANYAKKVGFVTKIRNTNFDKTRKKSKIPINQSIHCTREGYRESRVKAATQAKRITAMRCRARMYVMLDREKEKLRHSHPCSAKKAVHYHEYRELTMHVKCVITDNDEVGIRPNETYLVLANEIGGSSNLSFSENDVRNYITRTLRCADDNADFKKMMNYFVRMKEINPNFFYAIDVDDANKFRSALWVDVRHSLPFASFVGVNYHGKSTLLGCALLGSEEIPSFEWVFICVGTAPRGIITDQCKAMTGAIRKVLPDTVHRWCIWHILKKSQFKFGGYARYRELNNKMNHIMYNSPSADSFEVDWTEFIKEFDLGQNRWLTDLYANRRKWVSIFFKSEFCAGMRNTQRSESMNAFYGGFLHCKSRLVQFEQKELKDDDAESKGVIPCIGSTGIERQFQWEYTSNMFRDVLLEVRKKTNCVVQSTEQ